MEDIFGHMPYWKRVYQIVSGVWKASTVEDANVILDIVSNQLVQGISIFRLWQGEDNRLWDQFMADRAGVNRLVRRLAKTTDVEISVTWTIFCNYLSYVYHGRLEDMQEVSTNELYMTQFIAKYEHFYSMERMFMLRTMLHILNNHDNSANPFRSSFERFIDSTTVVAIRKSLLNQFHICHLQIIRDRTGPDPTRVVRSANEIKQICLMMVSSSWGRTRRIEYGAGETGIEIQPQMQLLLHYIQGFHFRKYGYLRELEIDIGTAALLDFHYAHVAAIIMPLSELWNNINLWHDYRLQIEHVYKESRDENMSEDSLVFIMQWSLLLITSPMMYDRAVNFLEQHQEHIHNALRGDALRILSAFLNSAIMNEIEQGHRIRLVVYRLFQELYVCLNANDGLYNEPGLVLLLVSLMEDKEIAQAILMGENEVGLTPSLKLNRIINTVEELFPFDFIAYSSILHSMMQLEQYKEIAFAKLSDLRTFTEERWRESVGFVASDYRPLGNDSIVAPAEQETHVLWRGGSSVYIYNANSYEYFDILRQLMARYLLGDRVTGHRITNDNYGTAILSGLDLMVDAMTYSVDIQANPLFAACISHLLNIIKMNLEGGRYDHDVVVRGLMVCVKLMDSVPDRMLTFLRGIGVLPTIHFDYFARQRLLTLETLNINAHLMTIVHSDITLNRGDVLDIIIDLIQHGIRENKYFCRVQLPLTVFLFEAVFPIYKLSFRQYCRPGNEIRIVAKIVELLHQILRSQPTADSVASKLRAQCVELLLTHEPLIQIFLYAAVRNTNSMIETSLCHRAIWSHLASVEQLRIARICVSTLLLLMSETGGCAALLQLPFGAALVNVLPNTVDHIQILAGLMNNSFEPELRQAACRLLSKFALNPRLKLLAHLELDTYQIRCLFLEKLRDPMEENTNRVAIIDLIAASVQCQNALTAAFFNFPKYMEDSSADLSDNVSSFIIEHLQNIQRFPDLRTSATHSAVLNLLEQVWSRGIELVMAPLMVMNGFWVSVASSIFEDFTPPNEAYCSVFNVFMHQIYISGSSKRQNPDEFLSVLCNMFPAEKDSWILRLIDYVRNRVMRANQEEISLLRAITRLLHEASEHLPEYFVNIEFRGDIAYQCLQGLGEYMKNPMEIDIVESWVSVYNQFIQIWGASCLTNYESDTVHIYIDILNQFAINFNYMSIFVKTTMFVIACNIIPYLKTAINDGPRTLQEFLRAIRRVIEIAEKSYNLQQQIEERNQTEIVSWTMLIVLTGHALQLNSIVEYKNWFMGSSFYKRVMDTASAHMTQPQTFNTAKYALNVLTTYVENDMHVITAVEEMEQFYRRSHPLREYLDFSPYDAKALRERPYEDFWQAYMALVQYNTSLLRKCPSGNFAACLSFFRMHWEVLDTLMKLPSVTVEPMALGVVQAILAFGCEMIEHKATWCRSDMELKMIDDFFVMVRVCINSCIQIMISPNIIKFYTRKSLSSLNVETVADEVYVQIIEQVLEILSTAFTCYNKATPSHVDLLCSVDIKRKLIGSNVIDADISIPKVSSNLNTKLCYGDLLFLHQILVQILYKVHNKSRPTPITKQNQLIIDPTIIPEDGNDSDSAIDLRRKIDKERRLLHQERKLIVTTPLTGFPRAELMGLVCPDYVHRGGVADWTTRRVHEPEISGTSAPWLAELSETRTLRALEALTTLLGNEIHLHLATYIPRSVEVVFYRRHFGTELRMFHNYVKKWRCGNVPLQEVLSGITYHYARRMSSTATAHREQPHAHRSLIPQRTASAEINPALIFSIETPVPNIFNEWRREDGICTRNADYFFAPNGSSPRASPPDPDTAALTNNYLLMLSHWLDYVCNIND